MRLKPWHVLGIIFLLAALQANLYQSPLPSQTVVPQCFSREDCYAPINEGFCDSDYDCVQGECYSSDVLCPETCYGQQDEDQDGLVDCADQDCWNSPYCSCQTASYTTCKPGRCYCPNAMVPAWFVEGTSHYCACTTG
jgi:hypothetical protein